MVACLGSAASSSPLVPDYPRPESEANALNRPTVFWPVYLLSLGFVSPCFSVFSVTGEHMQLMALNRPLLSTGASMSSGLIVLVNTVASENIILPKQLMGTF